MTMTIIQPCLQIYRYKTADAIACRHSKLNTLKSFLVSPSSQLVAYIQMPLVFLLVPNSMC